MPKMQPQSKSKVKEKIYKSLKPIVNDFTKPCKKTTCNHRQNIEEIKLEFSPTKNDDNVLKEVHEIFKCGICLDLFNKPVSCYKCNRIFCSDCIEKRLQDYAKCPKCLNMIFFELMPSVSEDCIEQYNQITIKCPYEGCKDTFNLNEFKKHRETCVFKGKTRTDNQNVCHILPRAKEDPYMKFHMMDYMRNLNYNKSQILKERSTNCVLDNKNIHLQNGMMSLTENVSHLIDELAHLKEATNIQIKGMIYN